MKKIIKTTNLHRAEGSIVETEVETYARRFDFAPVAYYSFNVEGKITAANLEGARLLGADRAHLLEKHFGSFLSVKSRPVFDAFIARIFNETSAEQNAEGVKDSCEVTLQADDTALHNIRIDGFLAGNSQECLVVAVINDLNPREQAESNQFKQTDRILNDITEKKKMEDAIYESEQRFKRVAEAAGEWIWEVDREGLYTYASPAVEKILGYSPEELVGKKHFYDLFTPAVREPLKAAAFAAFERGESIQHLINDNVSRDGRIVILETNGAPMFDENGAMTGYIGADTDITARRLAEEAIANNEAHLKAIFETSGILLAMSDPEGRFLEVNQAFINQFGYSSQEIEHMSYLDILHPNEVGQMLKYMNALQKGTLASIRQEMRFVNQNGACVWVDLSVTPLRDEDGALTALVGAGFDITERKKVEEALLESEERYRITVEQSNQGITIADQKGRYVMVNQAFCSMMGYTKEELLQMTVMDLLPDDTKPKLFTQVSRENKPGQRDATLLRKDGSRLSVSITGTPMYIGNESFVSGIVEDITEHKQAEAALRESEMHFHSILENSDAGYFFIDKDGIIRDVNPGWVKLYGYDTAGEIVGRHFAEVQRLDDLESAREFVSGILRADSRYTGGEFSRKRKDGSTGFHTFSARPVIRQGEAVGIEGFIIDSTEHKKMEEELRRTHAFYNAIIENSPVSIYVQSLDNRYLLVNHTWELERQIPRLKALGARVEDIFPEELAHYFEEENRSVRENRTPQYFESSVDDPAGPRFYQTIKFPILTPQGEIESIGGFSLDISERKKVQSALLENEQKYRTLINAMTEGVALHRVVYDEQHRAMDYIIEEVNPAFEKEVGIRAETARGALASAVYGVKPAPFLERYARVAESGHPYSFQSYFAPLQRHFDISVVSPRRGWFATIFTNITERKKIEDSLQRYRLLAENSSDIILFIRQQDGRILEANQAAGDEYGYSPAEMLALGVSDLTVPGELTGMVAQIELGYSKGIHFESRHRRKDGSTFPVEVSTRGASMEGQAVLLSIVRDISERKQAEETLLASKQRYESLFQDSPVPLLEIDLSRVKFAVEQLMIDGKLGSPADSRVDSELAKTMAGHFTLLDINQAGLDFFNIDDKTGFLYQHNYPPDAFRDWKLFPELMALMAGEKTSIEKEFQINLPNGYERWIKINMVVDPEYAFNLERVLVALSDLTGRRNAENVLRQAEGRLRTLFETISQGVFFNDREGRIIQANPAAQHILGLPLEEILGRTPEDPRWQRINEDGSPLLPANSPSRKVVESSKAISHQIYGTYNPLSKDYRWLDVSAVPLYHEGEEAPYQAYVIFDDITERRQIEREKEALLAKTRRQAERLEVIIQISASLRQAQDENDMLQILMEQSSEGLKADTVLLGLIQNEELQFSLAGGEWVSFIGNREKMDDELIRLLINAKPVTYHSRQEISDARLPAVLQPILNGVQACLMIPFKVVDIPIGLLLAGYHQPLAESEDRLNLAGAIGEIAGITLQRMRLLISMEKLANDRAKDLSGLYNVISAASGSWDIQTVLKQVLEQALHIVNAFDGAILSLEADRQQFKVLSIMGLEASQEFIESLMVKNSFEGWVVENGKPILIPNINLDKTFHVPERMQQERFAYLGLPMRTRGQVMGVLIILRSGEPFNLEEITLIGSVADHIGLIIDNLSLYHFYEQAAISEERSRLARDLHDSATQSLYSVTLYAEASRATVEKGDLMMTKQYLDRLAQTAHLALQEMRLLVYELRPPSLEQDGLMVALRKRLESVEGRAGIQTRINMPALLSLDLQKEEHLFWIAMETLNNSLKHAFATQVELTLKVEGEQVVFMIKDNGIGYDLEKARLNGGMGLGNMQQRAQKIGARLEIITAPGAGSTVLVQLPLEHTSMDQ